MSEVTLCTDSDIKKLRAKEITKATHFA